MFRCKNVYTVANNLTLSNVYELWGLFSRLFFILCNPMYCMAISSFRTNVCRVHLSTVPVYHFPTFIHCGNILAAITFLLSAATGQNFFAILFFGAKNIVFEHRTIVRDQPTIFPLLGNRSSLGERKQTVTYQAGWFVLLYLRLWLSTCDIVRLLI